MLQIAASAQLKKDLTRLRVRNWNMNLFKDAVRALAQSDTDPIPERYNDHALPGIRQGYRMLELGRLDSWVILYVRDNQRIFLVRTGPQEELEQ